MSPEANRLSGPESSPLCRRRHQRLEAEGKVTVLRAREQSADELSLYLRDASKSGFSGTYFGQIAPSLGSGYMLDTPGARERLRLVWAEKTIDGVFMLGFERNVAS